MILNGLLKKFPYLLSLDVGEVITSIKNTSYRKKDQEFQTWFDINNGNLTTDEIISEDQEEVFPNMWNYKCIKFFQRHPNFCLDEPFKSIFQSINKELELMKEIEYVHIHSMYNFIIEPHVDGNLVIVKNLKCPDTTDLKQFGFRISDKTFTPTTIQDTWLDTNLIHSVWNYTNQEWKFLTVSLNKNYLIKD